MRQKYPDVFNDLCLYSEACLLLESHFYRLSARRFVQELFLSLTFEELYEEPAVLLLSEEEGNDGDGPKSPSSRTLMQIPELTANSTSSNDK